MENNRFLYGERPDTMPCQCLLQLAEMGVRNPTCSLIRTKAGISLYRVNAEGSKLILKVFEDQEDRREIDNYLMLAELKIPTLPLLGYTKNAMLLPDVNASAAYRLGKEDDLSDARVAIAIAKWYRCLHKKGYVYLMGKNNCTGMYDESDLITSATIREIARRTDTVEDPLWRAISENYGIIRMRLNDLPKTLTFNDFYYTNLIVSLDYSSAFMFDYNLMGKGYPYADIRNVTSSLSGNAAEIFLKEYGDDFAEEQKNADAFIAPLVTLIHACKHATFPSWAQASLTELKNGDILRNLQKWLISGL